MGYLFERQYYLASNSYVLIIMNEANNTQEHLYDCNVEKEWQILLPELEVNDIKNMKIGDVNKDGYTLIDKWND